MSTEWPTAKFSFEIIIDGYKAHFTEVSGLDMESQVIEYRKGNSPQFSTIKMPGLQKFSNVTLKRGVFKNDNKLWDWFNNIKMNTVNKKTVTINLLDETKNPVMTWTLSNAWPTKIQATDMKADGNEVAVESIEISHEGLTIATG